MGSAAIPFQISPIVITLRCRSNQSTELIHERKFGSGTGFSNSETASVSNKYILDFDFPRQIALSTKSNTGTLQRGEEFNDRFLRTHHSLKFDGGNNHCDRVTVPCHRLRTLGLSFFNQLAELILSILERPRFHPSNYPRRLLASQGEFWPVKLDSKNTAGPRYLPFPDESRANDKGGGEDGSLLHRPRFVLWPGPTRGCAPVALRGWP